MSFANTDYIYDHLPARFRGRDDDGFLKRFLQFFGGTLDEWDAAFDAFNGDITSGTAVAIWIEFWLLQLFGWSWFPWWFTVQEKRRLYSHFARHLARRGTRRGIELWLADFGINARVHTRVRPWGEFIWGESTFAVSQPLHLVIEILFMQAARMDVGVWGEGAFGEFYYTSQPPLVTNAEVIDLIRYVQPQAQEITLVWRTSTPPVVDLDADPVWEQIGWEDDPLWDLIGW
jgi:phage tail-like protein